MRAGRGLENLARRYRTAARGAERAGAFPLLLDWGRHYLAAHFSQASSPMHRWLETQLAQADEARRSASLTTDGARVNLIGPRGHAKSTVATLAYVLKCAVERREPYIWIVSDTKEQAQLHLENVKRELVENARLAADYPLSVGKGPSTSLRTGRSTKLSTGRATKLTTGRQWQRHAIELPNGVVIEAWSTGQRIRGRRRREHRPTLIVCDDLQNDSHMSSAVQREATRRWFHGTLLKAGTKTTNVVNLATALHRDALAMELLAAPGWTSARFAAIQSWPTNLELWQEWEKIYCGGQVSGVRCQSPPTPDTRHLTPSLSARAFYDAHRAEMEAGADVLWPEVEDLYTLMRMRVESGHAAFEREKQGSPVDPESCEWPESYFEAHLWFEAWPAELVVRAMALDPSKGHDARRGDYSALVMLGIDAAGVIYVEADLARRATPQMVADGVAWCGRFRPLVFGVESNQYQELLAGEIEAEFGRQQVVGVVPAAIHNTINKQVRIRRLGPYLSQRRLRFLSGSASTKLLVDQLRDFPAGAHDDGPDALEMALRLAEDIWLGKNANDGLGNRLIHEP